MIALSSHTIAPDCDIKRASPRPSAMQGGDYAARYDWDTLFYDVYRSGRHVVFQGPPFLDLFDHLKAAAPFKGAFGFPRFAAKHFDARKRGEIWLKSDAAKFAIDGPLGRFDITVQPDMAAMFAGRRVITTLSQNNDLRWIADWVRFYRSGHGADGVLVYDNASSAYTLEDLQATLDEAAQGIPALAVSWPFKYGPQGGMAGAVNGVEAPWDSDFCQTGSLQHARFRFLTKARSVLNVDIDELVLGDHGGSIFAATEASHAGFIKFPGRWIATYSPQPATRETCRHADFAHYAADESLDCPPKWCVVPGKGDKRSDSWSVHNLFGAKANKHVNTAWHYRHMRGITTSWKEERWQMGDGAAGDKLVHDEALASAFATAGLEGGRLS